MIKGNTLDLGQATALLGGENVLGAQRDVQEVQNAVRAYDRLNEVRSLH